MTLLVRFSVSLLLLCALLKISQAKCDEKCAENETETFTADTTTVTFESSPSCNLSIGNHTSGQGSISGLTPGTVNTIFLGCFNCCKNVTTKPAAVVNLTVHPVTTSSISLMWTKPEGERSFYRVKWTNGKTSWNQSVTETNINVIDLTAGVQYNFTVTAVAGDDTTESEMVQTSTYTKPAAVMNLTVHNVTTSSMFLNWTEPEGQRSFYRVKWTNGITSGNKNVTETNIKVTDLTAGVQYKFIVTAVAGDDTTESEMVQTSTYTKPEVVKVINVHYVTTSSMFLNWTEPEGQRSFFRVQWTIGEIKKTANVTDRLTYITNLTAGVQYEISVSAVADDNSTKGEKTTVFKYTKPAAVMNLMVHQVTTSSMFLNWTEPEGQRSFYRVKWTNGKTIWKNSVTETNIKVTDLTAGVQYKFTVTAVAGDDTTESEMVQTSTYTKPAAVMNLTVHNVTTSSMFLNWTEPEGQRSFYRVKWTNGKTIWKNSVTETNIKVTNLTAGVQYNFTVTAVAGDDTTESEMVQTSTYTKPAAVMNLMVHQVTTSSMFLNWTEPEGQRSFFRVKWTNGKTIWKNSVTETNINVTDLTAGVQYNFTVTAVAGDDTTESEMVQTSTYTKPEVVKVLNVHIVTTSSMFLNWTEPEGQRSFFRVQWTNGGIKKSANVTDRHTYITNLTAGVQYEISVSAVADDNSTKGEKTTVFKYTKPAAVMNLTVHNVTTSSMFLNWTEPEGQRSFYRVKWTNGKTIWKNSVTETNINVTDLTAGVQYNFTVTAVAGDDTTESEMVQTSTYTKPEVVKVLNVHIVTTSSMFLNWTEPEGQRSFFRVQWTNGGIKKSANVTDRHTYITNLTAGVQYEISVSAVADDNSTKGEKTTVFKYTKPAAVMNLTVHNVTTSSMFLNWTEPEGQRSFYRVKWTNGKTIWKNSVTETNINVTDLTAGVQYNFTVTAVAGDDTTESEMVQTSTYTKPEVVKVLNVHNVTTSSMFLNWTEPEGQRSFFRVQWTNGGIKKTANVTDRHTYITNLTAGVQYEISVSAVADDNSTKGEKTTVFKYTKPAAVVNLTVHQVKTSSISLMWTKPEGQRSFYRVKWTNGITSGNKNVTETNIKVTDLTAGVQYKFTVTAVAGDDTTESEMVQTSTYTKPEVVKVLNVHNVTTSSMFLNWTEPEGQRSFFRVQWTSKHGETNETANVTDRHTYITNLNAGVQYEISVSAVADDNSTKGEKTTVFKYTKPAAIVNLMVHQVTTSSISLKWTKPEGQRSFYRVKWTNGKTSGNNTVTETNIKVTNLTAGVQYNFTVTAVAGDDTTESEMVQTSTYTKPEVVKVLNVHNVTTSSMFLNWTEPEGQRSFFRVQWTSKHGETNETAIVTETYVHITNLTPGVQYVITVSALACDGSTEGERTTVFKYTKPGSIGNHTVSTATSSIHLTWTPPPGEVSEYRVTWDNGGTVKSINTTTNYTELPNLIPGTAYSIRIIAVNEERKEGESYRFISVTKPARVKDLKIAGVTTTSVFLSWTKPEGNVTSYRVEQTEGVSFNTADTSFNITGLTPGDNYTCTVFAVARDPQNEGEGNSETTFTVPVQPENIRAKPPGTDNLDISWTLPHGRVDHYVVNILNENLQFSRSNTTTENRFHFTGLKPGRLFVITVTSVAGDKQSSNQVKFATAPTPPGTIHITDRTNSSLHVKWETPASMEGAPDISYHITCYSPEGVAVQNKSTTDREIDLLSLSSGTRYNIFVQTAGPQDLKSSDYNTSTYTSPNPVLTLVCSPKSNESVEVKWSDPIEAKTYYNYSVEAQNLTGKTINNLIVSKNVVEVEDLDPGTHYNISVWTIAAPEIHSAIEYTLCYTKPTAVTNLRVVNVTTTTAQLSWALQWDHKSSYSYLVMAFENSMLVHNDSTKDDTYTFTDLCPGSFYTFKVITVVEGVRAEEATTSDNTAPALVSNISVLGSTNSLSVTWTAAGCKVDSYSVWLYSNERLIKRTDPTNATVEVFDDLTPGVVYCVEVVSKTGSHENKISPVCNATFPNPPGPIKVESQTVDSINFTWTLPKDMDHGQYKFRVFSFGGPNITENSWFLLSDLLSGSPYNISVVTVGVKDYESTAETAKIYTRPHPVTLKTGETQITTNTVTLFWEQSESKPDYLYEVQVSNNNTLETFNTTATINDLFSGSNYTFTVTSMTADRTRAAPVTAAYFTRPYAVRGLDADTLNTTTIHLSWMKPLDYKSEYTYRVQTSSCDSPKNQTLAENSTLISELTPGTNCTFCVSVRAADGIEGQAMCTSNYTKPEVVFPIIFNEGSNNSLLVLWTKPAGRVERYMVNLTNNAEGTREQVLSPDSSSFRFVGLSAGRIYDAVVITQSGPFKVLSENVTNATLPNPPGNIVVLEKTTNSIQIEWAEAPLMTGASYFYQLTNISGQEGDYISAYDTTHNFVSLLSGTPYNISVLTVGDLNFKSEEVQINMVFTRPFSVKSLHASTDEENIDVTWIQPDQYKESYRFNLISQSLDGPRNAIVKGNSVRLDSLAPGSPYNISVTTETSDGTQGDPKHISNCTKASPVVDIKCEGPNKAVAELVLSWDCPRGRYADFKVSVHGTNRDYLLYTECNGTVSNLHHYTEYSVTVETQSCGQPSSPVSLSCMTGITDPPAPKDVHFLVTIKETQHNKFVLQINSTVLSSTNGPITHVGVLVTDKEPSMSEFRSYLGRTYDEWVEEKTLAYLATVIQMSSQSRSGDTQVTIEIGDDTTWKGYTNGVLRANGEYKFAVVLFTSLILEDNRVNGVKSLVASTQYSTVIRLPISPTVIGLAVGSSLGIFCILVIILIGFIIYWRRISKKESPDIQIHTLSAAVNVEDFEAYYRKQKADSNCGFAEEFEDLKTVGVGQSKSHALNLENKPKNRYNNVLPYDSSRVKLSIIHGSPYDDYINANYMPGYNSRKEFIAAQGPLPHTVSHFWRMIWEKNVHTLVMLTRCNEQGRVKCEQYWAPETKHFENIIVTTTSDIPLKDWTIRDFDVKNVKTAETRSVRHFHFTAWPDHGVPETTELLINFRHLVREHMDQYSRNSPTVVHCSAGVGRTGTFIAIDHLIIQIERENVVDVYNVVHDLRMHRPFMVQTEDQYVFLNQCAMDIIKSRTGTNVDLIYQNAAALSIYENVEPKNGYFP
ncbi:tenascin-X-like isoform X5 [Xyrichtys novacula]|uniref:protein-tyrosine-phosphatase n=1 Tax=Xyrichtys novacula TaxID=13765 RepID=A0AAV1F9M9_XYRNO|nr:tenascin-X-like isoform X5 [Xyrichtys novacula]